MSTILRALKKLELDKEPLGARDLSHTVATAASAQGRPAGRFGSSKRLLRVAVFAVTFIGVSGAAAYFFIQSRPTSTQVPQSSESVRIPVRPEATAPAQRTINRSDSNRSQSKQPPPQTKPAPQRKGPPDRPSRSELTDAGAQAKPPVLPKRIESRERLVEGQNQPKATSPDAATAPRAEVGPAGSRTAPADPAMPTGSAPPGSPTSEDDSTYANADRLMDNRLKIQAIAWSPVPDERMAVINSRIVREGGSVEGFSVIAIRSDDVIVKEKGQLYKVVFGSP